MTQQAAYQQWLDFSERDLSVAKHLFETFHPIPYEIICYHCQQSGEKALKALYCFLGLPGGIPKTHDLSTLLDQMHKTVEVSDGMYEIAERLSPYGTAGRYPSDLNFDGYFTRKAIGSAQTMLDWVKENITSHENE